MPMRSPSRRSRFTPLSARTKTARLWRASLPPSALNTCNCSERELALWIGNSTPTSVSLIWAMPGASQPIDDAPPEAAEEGQGDRKAAEGEDERRRPDEARD